MEGGPGRGSSQGGAARVQAPWAAADRPGGCDRPAPHQTMFLAAGSTPAFTITRRLPAQEGGAGRGSKGTRQAASVGPQGGWQAGPVLCPTTCDPPARPAADTPLPPPPPPLQTPPSPAPPDPCPPADKPSCPPTHLRSSPASAQPSPPGHPPRPPRASAASAAWPAGATARRWPCRTCSRGAGRGAEEAGRRAGGGELGVSKRGTTGRWLSAKL